MSLKSDTGKPEVLVLPFIKNTRSKLYKEMMPCERLWWGTDPRLLWEAKEGREKAGKRGGTTASFSPGERLCSWDYPTEPYRLWAMSDFMQQNQHNHMGSCFAWTREECLLSRYFCSTQLRCSERGELIAEEPFHTGASQFFLRTKHIYV